jgi:RNA polymerase sigma factor (sigma-70 family)
MPSPGDSPHESLLAHLAFIRARVEHLCRRHRAPAETADELFGDLEVKLLANDCEVLRRFRGDARLTTYLSVVIDRFFHDWTAREWGGWRPNAAARAASPAAREATQLIARDGFSRDEALRIAAERHHLEPGPDRRRLDEETPGGHPRPRLRPVGLEAVREAATPALPSPEETLCAAQEQRRLDARLEDALAGLEGQDRLLVRLRYGSGLSVASIARSLGLRQRDLYTRLERTLNRLREHLQVEGVTRRGVREHLARLDRLPEAPDSRVKALEMPHAAGLRGERLQLGEAGDEATAALRSAH